MNDVCLVGWFRNTRLSRRRSTRRESLLLNSRTWSRRTAGRIDTCVVTLIWYLITLTLDVDYVIMIVYWTAAQNDSRCLYCAIPQRTVACSYFNLLFLSILSCTSDCMQCMLGCFYCLTIVLIVLLCHGSFYCKVVEIIYFERNYFSVNSLYRGIRYLLICWDISVVKCKLFAWELILCRWNANFKVSCFVVEVHFEIGILFSENTCSVFMNIVNHNSTLQLRRTAFVLC